MARWPRIELPLIFVEGAERALISDLVPPEARGKSFGIYYLVSGMGVLAGSLVFGELYSHVSQQAAFAVGAGLVVSEMTACAALVAR